MRIAIVEDLPPVAAGIASLTREILGDQIRALSIHSCLASAREEIEQNGVDLVLLDLNLQGEDGFDLLAQVASESFHTVVISGTTERAFEAFDYGILDFLGKPIDRRRLEKALDRFFGRGTDPPRTRFLSVRKPGGYGLIEVRRVRFAKGAGKYSHLRLDNGVSELHSKNLERLEAILPPNFHRVHKSYIVNLDYASRLHVGSGGRYALELRSGERIAVGRQRIDGVRRALS